MKARTFKTLLNHLLAQNISTRIFLILLDVKIRQQDFIHYFREVVFNKWFSSGKTYCNLLIICVSERLAWRSMLRVFFHRFLSYIRSFNHINVTNDKKGNLFENLWRYLLTMAFQTVNFGTNMFSIFGVNLSRHFMYGS